MPKTYYVTRCDQELAIADRYDLRQTRFRHLLDAGKPEHPHDVVATGFTAAGMREIIAKHFPDTDATVLPPATDQE